MRCTSLLLFTTISAGCSFTHGHLTDTTDAAVADAPPGDQPAIPDVSLAVPDATPPPGSCDAYFTVNASTRQITCTTLHCECRLDGVLVDTCTPYSPLPCGIMTSCCTF